MSERQPEAQAPRRADTLPPLLELTRVRILEFVREPEALFWTFVFPVLLALALGIAFRNPQPRSLRVGVLDSLPERERVVAALTSSSDLEVVQLSQSAAEEQLRRGKLDLVVESGTGSEPALRFDPTRPDSRLAQLAAADALQRGYGRRDVVKVSEQPLTEPGSRYIDFLIPGLIGLNLMGSGMWGLGFTVVVARNRNLLKRFAATPMRRSHYLLSFMLSRLLFLTVEVAAVVGFGWLVFGVAVRGSLVALTVVSVIGAMCFAGVGLLVAARPRTVEAVSGWMNLVMLPMWVLSGTFFSYERFPAAVQPAIRAMPLTALNDALRAVIVGGQPLHASWLELVVMTVWGVTSFVVALRVFRWQ